MSDLIAQRTAAPIAELDGGRPGAAVPAPRRRRRGPGQSGWWALLFIGPTAAGLLVFYLWPTVRTFILSFTESGPFGGSEFVGLDNYVRLFEDPELVAALRNTAAYTIIVLIGIPIAVGIAALLNTTGLRGRGVYRTLYFLSLIHI